MSAPFPTPNLDSIRVPGWFRAFDPFHCDEKLADEGYRRRLPHWRYEGATYLATFRLHDSLPPGAAETLHRAAVEWEQRIAAEREQMGGQLSATTLKAYERFQRDHFRTLQNLLDECHGSCLLRDPDNRLPVHLRSGLVPG